MAKRSKLPSPSDEPTRENEESPTSFEGLESLSTLQILDLIAQSQSMEKVEIEALLYLRQRIVEIEEVNEQAQEAILKLDAAVTKLSSPANRVGTLLALVKGSLALVINGGGEYYCQIDPRLAQQKLLIGTRVLLNDAFVIVGDLGFDLHGSVYKVADVLADNRIRVGQEGASQQFFVQRSEPLSKERLSPGMEVRLDASARIAVEVVRQPKEDHHLLEQVPELPWDRIGGQAEAVQALRDAVELPLTHADLFQRYQHHVPKGFLLYGPPGCGKTLLGKATAYNLTRQLAEKTGHHRAEFFLHVKGPEILNMWVGESERQVRELFAQAREKSRAGYLPFIFIDEAESILGTRRGGRFNSILSTLVPMFCTEMDGIESLNEMVIILASNRADLIDPAILRPGRIDRKIKVSRPDRSGSAEIYRIYLSEALPFAESVRQLDPASLTASLTILIDHILDQQFSTKESNRFLEVTLRNGRKDYLSRGDLISGAIIASIVERAKELAIKRTIADSGDDGLTLEDFLSALDLEYRQNDIFPPNDITEDWLKLIDYDPENVVKVSPLRGRRTIAASAVI